MAIATQDRESIFVQEEGVFNPLGILSLDKHGMDDATDNTIPGRSVLFGRDGYGRPQVKVTYDEAPSGLVTGTINFDKQGKIDYLEKAAVERAVFNLFKFFIPAGRIDIYRNWVYGGRLDVIVNCRVSTPVLGAGPNKDYAATPVQNSVQYTGDKRLILRPPSLAAQVTTEGEDLNCIAGLIDLDPNRKIPGYPGHDKIMVIGADAASGESANILITVNGGATWTAMGALPFGDDEHINAIAIGFISPTQFRVIALRETTDAAAPAEIAYTDILLGNEAASPTWVNVNVGANNADVGQAMLWDPETYERLYIAASGDIYVSTNQGQTVGTAIYTGSTAISAIHRDPNGNVWAVGASNLILKERAEVRGTFDTKVGPSGGGTMHSIAVADDGTIFVGNGTKIFRSRNDAASAGGWTQVVDFGANHQVQQIDLLANNSQLLRAIVSDTSGNEGDMHYSFDGGNSFIEVDNLANAGYNAAYFSKIDPNFVVIVGEDNTTGVIHKVTTAG